MMPIIMGHLFIAIVSDAGGFCIPVFNIISLDHRVNEPNSSFNVIDIDDAIY